MPRAPRAEFHRNNNTSRLIPKGSVTDYGTKPEPNAPRHLKKRDKKRAKLARTSRKTNRKK